MDIVAFMTSNLTSQIKTEASAAELADRVAALELYLQQLVFVLDAQGAMNADALSRWMALARARMLSTGSAPISQVQALAQLCAQVEQ